MKLYADIAKTEEQDDGTIKVWGWASTGAVDSDGEIITPDAMKAALPDYMKFGAVREMHQSKAAGTAIEAEVQDDGKTWFGAHVVDSEAVKKVKANVYKGFSIGGKVTDRDTMNKSIIKGIKLVEVSLVDRPANPEAVITIMKAERTAEDDVAELAALLDAGTITPARLIELAKAEFFAATTATEEVATTPEQSPTGDTTETVEKGLWNAQRIIEALGCMRSVCDSAEWEAKNGEHSAEMVEALKAAVQNLGALAQQYLGEEMTLPAAAAPGEAIAMAEGADGLEKKGAKFSRATKSALGMVHKGMKECVEHLDKLGYEMEDDDGEKAEQSDDLAKAQADTITKLNADIDALKAEVQALKDQPMPGKALLKAIAVAKSDDSNLITTTDQPDPALTLKGEALALHQIKTMYRAVAR
jgi:phage head maturation protease